MGGQAATKPNPIGLVSKYLHTPRLCEFKVARSFFAKRVFPQDGREFPKHRWDLSAQLMWGFPRSPSHSLFYPLRPARSAGKMHFDKECNWPRTPVISQTVAPKIRELPPPFFVGPKIKNVFRLKKTFYPEQLPRCSGSCSQAHLLKFETKNIQF